MDYATKTPRGISERNTNRSKEPTMDRLTLGTASLTIVFLAAILATLH